MKKTGILLLSLVSISVAAQEHVWAGYPKWFIETIPYISEKENNIDVGNIDPAPVKTISLSTGVKLEYIEQGDPKGLPVILLHGFPDSWRSYEKVLNHLPKSLHVFAISQRGHGNSDKPAKGYFPKDFAGDVAAFIKALQLPPAIIVGHSMGATITQQFVLSYPHLVRGIVLEGAIASFNDKKDMMDYKQLVDQLKDPLDTALAREFQQSTLANPIDEGYFNVLLSESMKVKANVWKGVWEGLTNAANFRTAVYQVKKPALIIWGDKDNFGPRADQDLFVTAIEGSQLVVYKGTGHSLHWEEPVRFASDVSNFINSIK
jgi:pimeloyl-ACP methyl ester carboxylesterase